MLPSLSCPHWSSPCCWGWSNPAEALFLARVTGAALIAIGVSCWGGRSKCRGPGRLWLLLGVLIYDAAAAALLTYTGFTSPSVGIALWPAVFLHLALGVWCAACLCDRPGDC